jgi:hypothetical protein
VEKGLLIQRYRSFAHNLTFEVISLALGRFTIMGFLRRRLMLQAFLLTIIFPAYAYGANVKTAEKTVSFQVNLT